MPLIKTIDEDEADSRLAERYANLEKNRGKVSNMTRAEYSEILDLAGKLIRSSAGRDDVLSAVCWLLKDEVEHYDWVGIYFADMRTRTLKLGPFAGEPTEHTKIGFGDGICGQAAETENTFVVQDVSKETNYLSCGPVVKSEIVVPVFKDGLIVGELDIDSHMKSPFSDDDRALLEKIAEQLSELF